MIGELDIRPHRKSVGQTCDGGNPRLELFSQVRRRRFALRIGIGSNDHLGEGSSSAPIKKFTNAQLLRAHTIDGRQDAVQNVVEAPVPRLLERNDFERFLHNENSRGITSPILAENAPLLRRNHLTLLAVAQGVLQLEKSIAEVLRRSTGAAKEIERDALGGFWPDARQLLKLFDGAMNLERE